MKQFNLKTSILKKVSGIIPLIAVLLVPIFFLPTTTEYYSFNKLALLTVVTLLLIIFLGIKIATGDKIELIKSSLDKPIIAILVVMALSTIFSVNKTDSIFGSQGRWLGLLAFGTIVAYFFLSTPEFKSSRFIRLSLYALLTSAFISSLVSTLAYYKIFLGGVSFLRLQTFSLQGSIVDTIIISVLAVLVSIMLLTREKLLPLKIALFTSLALNFFFVAITGTLIGWALLLIGIIAIILFTDKQFLFNSKFNLLLSFLIVVGILAVTLIPITRKYFVDKSYLTEVILPIKGSWLLATSVIQDYPILATGPATFHLNYTRYKPLEMNTNDSWDRRFDEPYNELFNVIATLGLLGTAVALYFGVRALKFAYDSRLVREETGLVSMAGVLTIVLLISFLFTYATVLNVFLLFFALSILIGANTLSADQSKHVKLVIMETQNLASIAEDRTVIASQYSRYILCLPLFLIAGYLGYLNFRTYAGEYYMRRSLNAIANNDAARTYSDQNKAIQYNPKRDTYYDSFARTNITLANAVASKPNLTDADKQTIQTLVTQAIGNARLATEVYSPLNAANWETRALIYKSLLNVAQNASDWAINSYNTAIQLDPANPRLRLDLGGIYFAKNDFLSAANQFRQATVLKQDYANAHFNFALSLEKLQQYDQAKRELDITKLLVPQDSPDAKMVEREIANLPKPVTATTTAEKPTVEQLTGVQQGAKQEPLSNTATQQDTQQNLNSQALPQPVKP